MPDSAYVTTYRRRILSIFLGAATGGFLALVGYLFTEPGRASLSENIVAVTIVAWVMFSLPFLVGIGLVAPVWRWAERRRVMGWKAAGVWGALVGLPFSLAPFAALLNTFLRKYGPSVTVTAVSFPTPLVVFAIACPVIGCLVALTTWRFAYRRQSTAVVGEIFS